MPYCKACFEFLLADYTRVLPELNMRLHKRLFREQAKEFNDLLLQFFSTWRLRALFLPNLRNVFLVPAAATAAFRAHNEAADQSEQKDGKKAKHKRNDDDRLDVVLLSYDLNA